MLTISTEPEERYNTPKSALILLNVQLYILILLPYTFKIFDKINNEEIEKEKIKKKLIIMLIIFIIISIFEVQYLASLQMGTLQMITKK